LKTTISVKKEDLTSSFRIKNQKVLDKCDELIRKYKEKLAPLFLEVNHIGMDEIIELLKTEEDKSGIDFVKFCRKWIANQKIKGIKNYSTALNNFCLFMGREHILATEITSKKLKEYTEYLSDKPRAQSLYPTSIVKMFHECREYYNDEDNEIFRVKNTVTRFTPAKQNVAEKRSIPLEMVRKIARMSFTGSSVADLARDCFVLSFFLMGINSVDLYNLTQYDGEYIIYNRTKTKDRRADKSLMKVKVHPFIKPLFLKYRGRLRTFNFYTRYENYTNFNRALNMGLKEIGERLGIEKLQFYSARHSFASIAVNVIGINKWMVNDMLCHTDASMKVTDLYIQKDFTPINEANFKLLDYVLEIEKPEMQIIKSAN
jgi:integrase